MALTFQGKPVLAGSAKGRLMKTDVPVNFTAAFTKMQNILPGKKAEVHDRHHPWYKMNIKGRILVLPTCIGSTHTGLVLLDLVRLGNGPAGIIAGAADTLLVSGIILSEVWYGRSIPVVEYPTDELLGKLTEGTMMEINGETGEISAA